MKGEIIAAPGSELPEVLAVLESRGRRVQSISVGRSNGNWIVEVAPVVRRQAEFGFADPPALTTTPFSNAG